MTRSMRILSSAVLALLVGFSATIATAQNVSGDDRKAFELIIGTQISAFRNGDHAKAFSFASPFLRKRFQNPARFIAMVRAGYEAIYSARSFRSCQTSDELGGPTQHVHIVGPKNQLWRALYGFQKQEDGSWRIADVVLLKVPDTPA